MKNKVGHSCDVDLNIFLGFCFQQFEHDLSER